jgi:16S rRNA (cytosine1402-N4)-methyltransferase
MRRYGEAVRFSFQPVLMNLPSDYMEAEHQPVMLPEVMQLLQCRPGSVVVDATLGLGGHAREILERILPGGMLIGIDRDRESLEIARFRLIDYSSSMRLYHENYKNLPLVLNNLGIKPVDGILIDLGVSSFQMLSRERGFSFQGEGMLDMRMDQSQRVTAANLVNELEEETLADIIYRFGEERMSRRIASAIVAERSRGPITRSAQLAEIVSRAVRARGYQRIHPATRTFQALRIAVNRELEGLEEFLVQTVSFLKPGGRLVVIAFHSLEDRIVKTAFRRVSGQCICNRPPELCQCSREGAARVLTRKPLTPQPSELAANPRSRSARVRAVERN